MSEGRIVASGKPQDVISAELLADVFGLEATVIDDPVSDRPLIVPIGTRHVYGAVGGPHRER
jgi:iron complex transport system ATP-binding protein